MKRHSKPSSTASNSSKLKPFAIILLCLVAISVLFALSRRAFISPEQKAVRQVNLLPEVKQFVLKVPGAKIEMDHFDSQTGEFIVHVYEVKNGHTATFNWYAVNPKSGQVTPEF